MYNETNPSGMETLMNVNGCDSVVTINLQFNNSVTGNEDYVGCEGDGYSVLVNGIIYNETNPSGMETLMSINGCDSVVTINLQFNNSVTGNENYVGCEGDGYSVLVNGTLYDELNPAGMETLMSINGCDSVVTINLQFNNSVTGNEDYVGCEGDGYNVLVNGILYDEFNPAGVETLTSSGGCDSVVVINLQYNTPNTGLETYSGCFNDGYSVTVNGVVYNETNPSGMETLMNVNGCDSVVTINLQFNNSCLLYTSPSPRDKRQSRMPSSA